MQFTLRISNIRALAPVEANRYWPGNEGRWRYLVECTGTTALATPFNLRDVLGADADVYDPVMTFKRLTPQQEQLVLIYLASH